MKSFLVFWAIFGSVSSFADFKQNLKSDLQRQTHLPISWAIEALDSTKIQFHEDSSRLAVDYGETFGRPYLVLYRPYFQTGGSLTPFGAWTVDMLSPFFEALWISYDLQRKAKDPNYKRKEQLRAASVYTDVPQDKREEVFAVVKGEWLGHVLAMAQSLHRSFTRPSSQTCQRLQAPMFNIWERNYIDTHFFGAFYSGKDWTYSRVNFPQADREKLRLEVFEGRFKGDRQSDFAQKYCK